MSTDSASQGDVGLNQRSIRVAGPADKDLTHPASPDLQDVEVITKPPEQTDGTWNRVGAGE